MNHRATSRFWNLLEGLPPEVQAKATRAFALLKTDLRRPSLHLKKIGKMWSVRVDLEHRALGVDDGDDILWIWIGPHDEYDRLIQR